MVKGNVAVIRKSGDGEFEDMEMNMHFVNKKIKYTWDANLQVIAIAKTKEKIAQLI